MRPILLIELNRIFEPFQKKTEKRDGKTGTGLGLISARWWLSFIMEASGLKAKRKSAVFLSRYRLEKNNMPIKIIIADDQRLFVGPQKPAGAGGRYEGCRRGC